MNEVLNRRLVGVPEPPFTASVVRELTLEDVSEPAGSAPKEIQKIRDSHHRVARLLAQGLKDVEVSVITGYSQSRICILKSDPAFKELLEHYRVVSEDQFKDVLDRVKYLALDSIQELQERLDAGALSAAELIKIMDSGLDRGGVPRITRNDNRETRLVLTGEDLAKLKEEAASASRAKISRGARADMGGVIDITPTVSGEESASRPARAREDVREGGGPVAQENLLPQGDPQ